MADKNLSAISIFLRSAIKQEDINFNSVGYFITISKTDISNHVCSILGYDRYSPVNYSLIIRCTFGHIGFISAFEPICCIRYFLTMMVLLTGIKSYESNSKKTTKQLRGNQYYFLNIIPKYNETIGPVAVPHATFSVHSFDGH